MMKLAGLLAMHQIVLMTLMTLSLLSTAYAVSPPTSSQMQMIEKAVKSKLKDPYSVKISKVRTATSVDSDSRGKLMACGLFNAKNSFGAYVGNSPFMGIFMDGKFILFGGSFESHADKKSEQFTLQLIVSKCSDNGIYFED